MLHHHSVGSYRDGKRPRAAKSQVERGEGGGPAGVGWVSGESDGTEVESSHGESTAA